jgi:acetyl-CoA acetyltransferase family protein
MTKLDREIWIVAAKRTAFGTFGGSLKELSATDLAVEAAQAALAEAGIRPDHIDQVIFGNVQQTSADAIYLARHVGLRCGVPVPASALTLNRLCGSGFQAVVSAAEQILLHQAEAVLCGGTESMSQAPHVIRGARWGLALGKAGPIGDTLWDALTDTYTGLPMALTAENLAQRYDISRAACDEYALRSQRAWAEAQEAGRFKDEIAPIQVPGKKGPVTFQVDEHPRPQTTLEGLARLPTVFKKDGVITAGNASGICDGAAALVVASREAAVERGWKPLGRLVGWGDAGCDPAIMGIGPVPAIQRLLQRTGRSLADFGLVEINEAFAPQYLAVERELSLDRSRTNVNGGAIALGHPLGASGARITTHLLYELRRRGQRLGLGAACIGGGQGIAVAVEAL